MPKINLSDRNIKAIKPELKLRTFIDTNVKQLHLRVGANNSSFVYYLNYTRRADNKRVNYKIGPISKWDVPSARAEANTLLGYIASGGCPQTDKQHQKLQDLNTPRKFLPVSGLSDDQQDRVEKSFALFLDKPLSQITPEAASRHRMARQKAGVAPQTLNRDRGALLSAINKAVEQGLIHENPLKRWKPLKVEKEQGIRFLTKAEKIRLMAALDHPRTPKHLKYMVIVAMYTGLRRGELFKLRYRDLTLNGKNPRIDLKAGTTKAKKSRTVPLNKPARQALKEWIALDDERAFFMYDSNGLVFPSPRQIENQTKYEMWMTELTSIKTAWRMLMKRAGIQGLRFHDLRHTCASWLVQEGVDLYVVKEILGHSTIELTQRYAHLGPNAAADALARLNGL